MALSVLVVQTVYLILFFAMSAVAAKSAGRSVWLFGSASGRDKAAAIGFRLAFALSVIYLFVSVAVPELTAADPLLTFYGIVLGAAGFAGAVAGAMIAFAAQVSMGASWRVGVKDDALGALISGGLYDFSRNPTFVGQGMLLAGSAVAAPSLAALIAFALFSWSAFAQVDSEEAALSRLHGQSYADYCRRVPRWLGFAGNMAQ